MSDQITVKGSDKKFTPHPQGQYVGQCVDTIDLGENVEAFAGTEPKVAHKCALVFRTGERNDQGDYIDIAREFTVSMNDRANLRKFLEQWRGRPYTAAEVEGGVPLHKLTGNHALLTISHKTSANQRTYANITACVGLPKQMLTAATTYTDYTRADYWTEKKKGYAEAVTKFRQSYEEHASQAVNEDFDDFPPASAIPDDEMPF